MYQSLCSIIHQECACEWDLGASIQDLVWSFCVFRLFIDVERTYRKRHILTQLTEFYEINIHDASTQIKIKNITFRQAS